MKIATFRKRGDYQWQVEIRRKGWPYQTKTFESKQQAEQWARFIESEMDKGIFVDRSEAESTTLKEALERYLREVTSKKRGKKQETARVNAWLNHKLASRSLVAIRGSDMAEYRDAMRDAGKAENTIRLSLAIISHLYKIASTEWGIEGLSNPIEKIAKPSGSVERSRSLAPGEWERIIGEVAKCRNRFYLPIAEIAYETGMRQGEILNMKWQDIVFKDGTVLVPKSKNGESRIVPLTARAEQVLQSLPRAIRSDAFVFGSGTNSTGKHGKGRGKGDLSADGLSRGFTAACKSAGVDDFHFHDLRHEAASRMAPHFEIHELAKVLGHKTIRMVLRYYQPKPADLVAKMRKLG